MGSTTTHCTPVTGSGRVAHVCPPSTLLNSPPVVTRYTVLGSAGSNAAAWTSPLVPLLTSTHVSPPSVLRSRRWSPPASTVRGSLGSTATIQMFPLRSWV